MDGSVLPPDLAELIARDPLGFLVTAERELVKEHGLAMFIRLGWHTIEGSEARYRSNWHIDAICDHLQGVSAGHIKRLMIAVPPRHMKSISVSVMWPATAGAAPMPSQPVLVAKSQFDITVSPKLNGIINGLERAVADVREKITAMHALLDAALAPQERLF